MIDSTHDPLCPRPLCDYGQPQGDCAGYEDCVHDCQCPLIAKVRADEREQAAQRVAIVGMAQAAMFRWVYEHAADVARGET